MEGVERQHLLPAASDPFKQRRQGSGHQPPAARPATARTCAAEPLPAPRQPLLRAGLGGCPARVEGDDGVGRLGDRQLQRRGGPVEAGAAQVGTHCSAAAGGSRRGSNEGRAWGWPLGSASGAAHSTASQQPAAAPCSRAPRPRAHPPRCRRPACCSAPAPAQSPGRWTPPRWPRRRGAAPQSGASHLRSGGREGRRETGGAGRQASGGARAAGGTAGALPAAPPPPSPSRQPARASPAAGRPAGGAPLVHSRRMRRSAASLPGPTVTSCAPSMSSTACDGEQAGQGRAAGLSGLQHRAGGTRSTRSTRARARLVPLPLPRAPARARRARRCVASWPVLSARSQRPRGPQQRVAGRWRAARSGAGASPAPARARGLARSGCLRRREQEGGGEERRVCSAPRARQPLQQADVGASHATGGTSGTRGQRFGQSVAEPQAFWLAAAAPTQVPEDLGALQPLERRGHAALQLQGACEHPGGS